MNRPTESTTDAKNRKTAPTASKRYAIVYGWNLQQARYWADQLRQRHEYGDTLVGTLAQPRRLDGYTPETADLFLVGRSHEVSTIRAVQQAAIITEWIRHAGAKGFTLDLIKGQDDIDPGASRRRANWEAQKPVWAERDIFS